MLTLSTPLEKLPGIGPATQKKLKKLGIKNVGELIFHFPHRYEDFSNLIPISKVKINEICTLQGKILEIKTIRTWKRRMFITEALMQDKTAAIRTIWFNRPYLTKILKKGDNVFLSGKTAVKNNEIFLSNPAYEKITDNLLPVNDLTHTGRLVPVYPETEGLSSRWIRYILKPLLTELKNKIPETLPEKILKENNFPALNQALWQIHFPDSLKSAESAKKRFSFEELFYIELFVLRERLKLAKEKAVSIPLKLRVVQKFRRISAF